jgi:hypothetical protein
MPRAPVFVSVYVMVLIAKIILLGKFSIFDISPYLIFFIYQQFRFRLFSHHDINITSCLHGIEIHSKKCFPLAIFSLGNIRCVS